MILVDNNILVRLTNSKDADHKLTQVAVFRKRQSDVLAITRQCLYEFWAVATRAPAHNGMGMDPARAARWLKRFRGLFSVLPDPPELLDRWQDLVSTYQVAGFQCHDARYVAAMQCYGIQDLMTYNLNHFKRYPITLIDPHKV